MYLLLCHIPVTIIKTTYLLGHFQSLPKYPFPAATAATIPVDISETKRSIGDLLVSFEALRFKVFNTHSCVHKDIKVSQSLEKVIGSLRHEYDGRLKKFVKQVDCSRAALKLQWIFNANKDHNNLVGRLMQMRSGPSALLESVSQMVSQNLLSFHYKSNQTTRKSGLSPSESSVHQAHTPL